jgi:metal-sulfur cluster biosynthetic enzyme
MPIPPTPLSRRGRFVLGLALLLTTTALAQEADPVPYADRTDNVDEKLRLLRDAYDTGDLDLARSLAESIRHTLQFESQERLDTVAAPLSAEAIVAVDALPKSWARWAAGWRHARVLTLTEAAGIERSGEPIDVVAAFPTEQFADLHREVRVARVDVASQRLVEVASQVYDVRRAAGGRTAHVVFLADAAPGGSTTYLLLHDNPNAELPEYTTDLEVSGDGYDLAIGNRHYTAHLSAQTGQLERMVYKRVHGLELYSGGKGHGEPPTIDWSNDYVDEEHFQKLRIRSWPEAPDYEVVRGPLVVQVRRWGFPASPLHPVYAPSRVEIDQTYTFYAGADYFLKDGTMRAIKDVKISALRDDEWVLSGYSFDHMVWIDAEGKLHEGGVTGDNGANLWGVGFYHQDSRDAFIVLWLQHEAEGLDDIQHNGSPTMHYYHHGQLWSRYPARGQDLLPKGTTIHNHNAYLVFPWPEEDASGVIETVRRRLLQPLQLAVTAPREQDDDVSVEGSLARRGETADNGPLKAAIWEQLRLVQDEQFYSADANIVDFGYVYDLRIRGDIAEVLVTMPHRGRPVWQFLENHGGGRVSIGIRERLEALDGIKQVVVRHTWYPDWTVSRITDTGRQTLGLDN